MFCSVGFTIYFLYNLRSKVDRQPLIKMHFIEKVSSTYKCEKFCFQSSPRKMDCNVLKLRLFYDFLSRIVSVYTYKILATKI